MHVYNVQSRHTRVGEVAFEIFNRLTQRRQRPHTISYRLNDTRSHQIPNRPTDKWPHQIPNNPIDRLTDRLTGQQGMLTPPWHLIPPLVFPGVRVSLILIVGYSITSTGHWFRQRIFPFTWFGHTDFDYWFLRLIWGARRVWPVGRGCLLLHGTWSHLWYIQRSVYAHSLICISYRTNEIDYWSLFLSFHSADPKIAYYSSFHKPAPCEYSG
jgi:hypothetical protein